MSFLCLTSRGLRKSTGFQFRNFWLQVLLMLSQRGLHIKVYLHVTNTSFTSHRTPHNICSQLHSPTHPLPHPPIHPLAQLLRSAPSQLMPHNDILLYALATTPERVAAFELFSSPE
jgi:hypothetical protein